jgi:hypothetical protein
MDTRAISSAPTAITHINLTSSPSNPKLLPFLQKKLWEG